MKEIHDLSNSCRPPPTLKSFMGKLLKTTQLKGTLFSSSNFRTLCPYQETNIPLNNNMANYIKNAIGNNKASHSEKLF